MELVFGHDAAVAQWVRSQIPAMSDADSFGAAAAIGVAHGGRLVGGVVYNDYRPSYGSIGLHFAATDARWLTGAAGDRRSTIRALLAYPFVQLGVARVTGITPKRLRRARAVIRKLGFRHEGCVRRGFGNDDAIISGLLRHEWLAGPYAVGTA